MDARARAAQHSKAHREKESETEAPLYLLAEGSAS